MKIELKGGALLQKSIDYYLSLVSPWSYLGHERLVKMAKQYDTTITIWPVDLSIIFPKTGGIPLPKRSKQRKAYRMQELHRWRDHSKVDLNFEPLHFPVSDKLAAAMVIGSLGDVQGAQGPGGPLRQFISPVPASEHAGWKSVT